MLYEDNLMHHGAVLPVDAALVAPVTPSHLQETLTVDANSSIAQIMQILQNVHALGIGTQFDANGTVIGLGGASANKTVPPEPGYYDDYSTLYGYWDSLGGIDWGGSNANSDGALGGASGPDTSHLDTSVSKTDGSNANTTVTFNGKTTDGLTGNQAVTQNLKTVTNEIIAATPGLTSANVSATTNGVHDVISDHYSGNAVDINNVNGQAISGAGKTLALQLEAQALADPNTRYVEGPGGNWARSSAGGTWARSADLPTMNNHVHWSTFRH